MLTPCISLKSNEENGSIESWIKLVDYGSFPHPKGLQIVTKSAAKSLTRRFKTLLHRFGWNRIPVYIGHPDDPHFSSHPEHLNKHRYGWVKGLRADEKGIWIRIKWTPKGRQLMATGIYRYLSPRWTMQAVKGNEKQFIPVRLLSMGLTNQPNLNTEPIFTYEHPTLQTKCTALSHCSGFKPCAKSGTLRQSRSDKTLVQEFINRVNERMQAKGESYPEAWCHVKHGYAHLLESF